MQLPTPSCHRESSGEGKVSESEEGCERLDLSTETSSFKLQDGDEGSTRSAQCKWPWLGQRRLPRVLSTRTFPLLLCERSHSLLQRPCVECVCVCVCVGLVGQTPTLRNMPHSPSAHTHTPPSPTRPQARGARPPRNAINHT
jgi:hypothetical protein